LFIPSPHCATKELNIVREIFGKKRWKKLVSKDNMNWLFPVCVFVVQIFGGELGRTTSVHFSILSTNHLLYFVIISESLKTIHLNFFGFVSLFAEI
jgi:hypothetical protein